MSAKFEGAKWSEPVPHVDVQTPYGTRRDYLLAGVPAYSAYLPAVGAAVAGVAGPAVTEPARRRWWRRVVRAARAVLRRAWVRHAMTAVVIHVAISQVA